MCRILGNLEPRLVLPCTAWVAQQVWVPAAPGSHGPRLWVLMSPGFPCPPGPAAPALVQTSRPPARGASVSCTSHTRPVPRTPGGALPSSSCPGGHPVPRRGFPPSALPMRKLRPGDAHGFLSAQGITRDQEGRRGSEEAVPGPSVFPSGEPGVSGDFWGSSLTRDRTCIPCIARQGIFLTTGAPE